MDGDDSSWPLMNASRPLRMQICKQALCFVSLFSRKTANWKCKVFRLISYPLHESSVQFVCEAFFPRNIQSVFSWRSQLISSHSYWLDHYKYALSSITPCRYSDWINSVCTRPGNFQEHGIYSFYRKNTVLFSKYCAAFVYITTKWKTSL